MAKRKTKAEKEAAEAQAKAEKEAAEAAEAQAKAEKEAAEAEEAAKAAAKAQAKADAAKVKTYVTAKAVTSKRGVLAVGVEVSAKLFHGGQDTINRLIESGIVVEK